MKAARLLLLVPVLWAAVYLVYNLSKSKQVDLTAIELTRKFNLQTTPESNGGSSINTVQLMTG